MKALPRYPVYVISKGRSDCCLTAKFLRVDGVPFRLVVEPQEEEPYRKLYGDAVRVLPFSNLGLGGIPARNWCWENAKAEGHARHWILDDNIRKMRRMYKGLRLACEAGGALAAVEDWTDRYENLAISGLNYTFFANTRGTFRLPPFYLNCHVYSCLLIDNALPYRWRGRYNEDTDLCLQVISGGLCTALVNAFLIDKAATMTMKGGNAAELYKGDGRLRMARSLQRAWPYVVDTIRRFGRPQHKVKDHWKRFDTPLKLKPGVDPSKLAPNEYGMTLTAMKEVQHPQLRELLADHRAESVGE